MIFWHSLIRPFITAIVWLVCHTVMKVTVTGQEHLPQSGPLLIVCNHFSWFEIPLLYLYTPYKAQVMGAAELQEILIFRFLYPIYQVIPVQRGLVDRTALKTAVSRLDAGHALIIFPEGGIDPDLMELSKQGIPVAHQSDSAKVRLSGELINPRPGVAFIATMTGAPILPAACINGENVLANLKKGKRTAVSLHFGPPFGPLTLDRALRGGAKREQLDLFGEQLMHHIAQLMPENNRGPYL